MVKKYSPLLLGLKIGIKEETLVSGAMPLIMENTEKAILVFKTTEVIYPLEKLKSKNFETIKNGSVSYRNI